MVNEKIINEMKNAGLKQWQLAELLGISEFHFSRKLSRHELPLEETEKIISVIHNNMKEGD